MKLKNIIILGAAAMAFTACDDLFEPAIENNQDITAMYNDAEFARGLLDNAFIALPYDANPSTDVATDDAVSNDPANNYKQMAIGNWSSIMNPVSQWDARFHAIQYCNIMIENAEKVNWSDQYPERNALFIQNYLGNAYALRAIHHFYALRAHAGAVGSKDGEIMGIPMHMKFIDENSNYNESRLTFKECYELIMADLNKADEYLPEAYVDVDDASEIPAKYKNITTNTTNYNAAFGKHFHGRVDGKVISAIKAQLALLAASPAYAKANACTYEKAAQYAYECINKLGGIANMQQDGWKIFANNQFLKTFEGMSPNPAEIIWRANINATQDFEKDNYPPSIGGNGRVNPTQNLVDAFPMANGMPITAAGSGYDPQNPYAGRDPRLTTYILVNGDVMGSANTVINTAADAKDDKNPDLLNHDGLAHEVGKSTVTGYYMRKHLRNDVNLTGSTAENHLQIRIRATEIFLAYAEAANAAQGPDAKVGGANFTAREVIQKLRERAGVGTDYINGISGKEAFQDVIRNERRIELCFENSRFWDLRRWQMPLNETAKGMQISGGKYTVIDVEKRDYKDYMYFGPLPYSEVIKWSNLVQNYGW